MFKKILENKSSLFWFATLYIASITAYGLASYLSHSFVQAIK